MSVVGFDYIPEAAYLNPPLMTVRQDFREVGRRSLEMLLNASESATVPPDAMSWKPLSSCALAADYPELINNCACARPTATSCKSPPTSRRLDWLVLPTSIGSKPLFGLSELRPHHHSIGACQRVGIVGGDDRTTTDLCGQLSDRVEEAGERSPIRCRPSR